MGNHLSCKANAKSVRASQVRAKSMGRRSKAEEELLQQQALAMALRQHQMRVERTSSMRNFEKIPKEKDKGVGRCASARPRLPTDLDPDSQARFNGIKEDALLAMETTHFVLVHGGGFGAWCWYKTIALLEEAGFVATPIDLGGSGIESTDPNTIATLADYAKPLCDFFEGLSDEKKVILIAHDFGGACISFAMEKFPKKIAKAVFITAAMVSDGQRAFDMFSAEVMTADDLLPKAQRFVYQNGNSKPPTALEFDKGLIRELFFNQSPAKDVALATVAMRPIPFSPILDKLCLTEENYGSVRRFFIETMDDNALPLFLQQRVIEANPPERVFKLKGSDHSPFFSKPQSLHKVLVEIASLPKTKLI